jgi:hypothetical protein
MRKKGSDDTVGYGKPPRHSRFKPGQSGNPKGRPRGSSNFKTDLRKTLKSRVRVTKDGKPETRSTQAAALARLQQMAISGNFPALSKLLQLADALSEEDARAPAAKNDELDPGDAEILELHEQLVRKKVIDEMRNATNGNSSEPAQDSEHPTRPGKEDANPESDAT